MADVLRVGSPEAQDALRGAHVAFGVFDGVHRGHRHLISKTMERAATLGGPTAVLTFDIDPDELFCPGGLAKLLSNGERLELLAATGVDAVCVLPFDRDFAALSPEEFLDVAFAGCAPASLHVGEDVRFGNRASGTLSDLERWGRGFGVEVQGHGLLAADGAPITATRIRKLLAAGCGEQARALLGR